MRLHDKQQSDEFHKKHLAKIRAGRLKSKKEAIGRPKDDEEMPTAISDHQRNYPLKSEKITKRNLVKEDPYERYFDFAKFEPK